MELKILACYLEENKFSHSVYEKQKAALERLGESFSAVIFLKENNISRFFSQTDINQSIVITTSPDLAMQMQGLGVAVVGFETDSQEMMEVSYVTLGMEEMTFSDLEKIYRRCHGLPWDILETERLKIREFSMQDMDALYELYRQPHITDDIEPLYAYEQEKLYQESYIKNIYGFYGYGMWLVFEKSTGELIGRAGLEYHEYCEENELELGYVISPKVWRRGYATEACTAIMRYAKDVLCMEKILCRVSPKNRASLLFLQKLGFQLTKKDKEWFFSYTL